MMYLRPRINLQRATPERILQARLSIASSLSHKHRRWMNFRQRMHPLLMQATTLTPMPPICPSGPILGMVASLQVPMLPHLVHLRPMGGTQLLGTMHTARLS